MYGGARRRYGGAGRNSRHAGTGLHPTKAHSLSISNYGLSSHNKNGRQSKELKYGCE